MSADERDPKTPTPDNAHDDAAPHAAGASDGAPADNSAAPENKNSRRRRRFFSWRNALIAAVGALSLLIILAIIAVVFLRTGRLDKIVANQVVEAFAEYGIRAEVGGAHIKFSPRTVEMTDVKLYDAQSGEQLGKFDRLIATVRIPDLYALNLRRNVNLEKLQIDNPEIWVTFDAQGRSNFRNLHVPPPEPNSRILFSYSTAQVTINNGRIHYGDELHKLSGEGRNIQIFIESDDPNAPAESAMNRVTLALDNSTFAYDGRAVENIAVNLRARVNETRADIQELTLHSPVAEARITGALDDWREFRYHGNVTSNVDLTQLADVLQPGTPLRGAGVFSGAIEGEGTKYKIDGGIKSDAIAADGVRLQGLNLTAQAQGDGSVYEAQARAVASLLASGDFQLNSMQLAGRVRGTGTDFRFVGDLQSAAARYGATSIVGLFLKDAMAESHDIASGNLDATVRSVVANSFHSGGATASCISAGSLRVVRSEKGDLRATTPRVSVAQANVSGTRLSGVAARDVVVTNAGGATQATVGGLSVGAVNANFSGVRAETRSINIAGVRLSIAPNGRVEATSGDIAAGQVALNVKGDSGNLKDVRAAHPVLVIEPSGRYRASADLSLGGGALGKVELGKAQARVVATDGAVQLNQIVADAMNGQARGDATIALSRGASSRVNLAFDNLDVGKLLSLTGQSIPVAAQSSGTVNLTFPGADFEQASGTLNATFNGNAGDGGRTPLTGEININATRGVFNIQQARLQTAASELNARGEFSFSGDSNLQVNLASKDAGELQRLAATFAPDAASSLSSLGIALAGNLNLSGSLRGQLLNPTFEGRLNLDPLVINNHDLGALTANLSLNPARFAVTDGRLTERDGGGITFTASLPRDGSNTGAINATLGHANAGNLLAAFNPTLPVKGGGTLSNENIASLSTVGDVNGRINVTGIPGALAGSADVRVGPGSVYGEQFSSIAARATFDGTTIKLDDLTAQLNAGRINANGQIALSKIAGVIVPTDVALHARGENVNLDLVNALAGVRNLPQLAGTVDFTADASASLNGKNKTKPYDITINAQGKNVRINGRDAGALTLVGRTENQKFNLQLTTGLLGQPQTITAQVDLNDSELPTTIETTFSNADLTPLFAALGVTEGVRVTGRANGTVRASGNLFDAEGNFSLAGLRGRAEFADLSVQVEDVALNADSPLIVTFTPSEINFERTRFTGTGSNITFGGTLALGEGGRQNFTADGDLNLRVLNGLDPNIFVAGAARFNLRVNGTFADPRATGAATIAGASFSTLLSDERLTLNNINGTVRFTDNRAEISSLTGNLGGGRVTVAGGAVLNGFAPTQFRFTVRGDNVSAPLPYNIRASGDADLVVQGNMEATFVSGRVALRRAEYTENIDLADLINRRDTGTLAVTTPGGEGGGFTSNVRLDLQVTGRDALVIRNNLADIVGSAELQIRGTIDDPLLSGRITATRGTLNFRNDRYDVTRAIINLPPGRDADPIVNIQAETDIKGYRIVVAMNGPLSTNGAGGQGLQTSVRSDPALPQADVISLITTGNLANDTGAGSILSESSIGTATSLLTDAIINAPLQRATDRLFGLNRFEIDPLVVGNGSASPTARLTVGRQINRNLSVTYSTNVTADPNQVVAVEYRVSDRLSFIAQYEQRSASGLRSQNNNFSFEIRFRKRF